ncbi:cytochrome c oxidase cbb3-type subunit 3 [Winogradskyella epiphytica]|uniref:Cytochrome c oxidase cbb3-type subunit 3 n=1 Tax=Winogradskyella epiphytica TaxID=262005 RepID=A0A2V4XEP2_9FLAO|nr:cbb3-type cytochrome c oxidase N-terminal domain-containing protein [Winogradskyella epiphytica]PYE81064.1 cytochrome c oxidase cbb3-type subunit 3 [Winogradskyella epiphytica]GGW66597.1 cytochrome c oxidase subunit III [Winogradskyella epiphytica]
MRHLIPSYIRVPVVFFAIAGLVEYFVDSGDKPAFIEQPIILLFLFLILLVLIAIEGIVNSLDNILYQSLDEEGKKRYEASRSKTPQFTKLKALYSKLVGKQKPIEEEGEIILDHNYDGIKELDNNLPPWWVYSFYISIVFAVIYMVRYHVLDADDQFVEYEIEYAEANAAIEAYKKTAKGLVDINTVEVLTETADLNAGKKIFETNCVACHMADGGGGIGPNLTDKHWILGGGIKNVFKTISEGGRSGKGMVAWKQSLKPLEMAQVASYVLQFQGTTPANPKAAEGDIWVPEDTDE